MKRFVILAVILCALFLVNNAVYADSLSTSKTITVTFTVVSPLTIKDADENMLSRAIPDLTKEPVFEIVYLGFD